MKSRRILCFGEVLWDITAEGRKPGGAPANVALQLAALGVETQLLTRVGNDALGAELTAWMADTGIDVSHVQVDDELPTGRVAVDATDPLNVSYEIAAPAAWDRINSETLIRPEKQDPAAVVFGSLAARHSVSRASLLALLEHSDLRVFDVNLRPPFDARETVEQLLEYSDWVKLNESECDLISSWLGIDDDIEKAATAIRMQFGLDLLCVTLGEHGALLIDADGVHRQIGFKVQVVDTIGCGDAFLAALLAETLRGASTADALRMACAGGALVATHAGANKPITFDALQTLIAPGC